MNEAWKRVTAAGAVAALFLALGMFAGTASAADGTAAEPAGTLNVDVSVKRFVVRGDRVFARGPAVAQVVQADGTTQTVRQHVRMRVKTTKRCRILKLHLAPLYLNLLGLEVRTSDINLRITGNPNGALGGLFCSLSRGLRLDRAAMAKRAAHSLNDRLAKRPLHAVAFRAPLYAQQQAGSTAGSPGGSAKQIPPVPPGSCEVLHLFLGPLHLNLLGLIVDLYGPTTSDPIEVLVTANPNGGVLGSLLCGVAGPPTT
jgi:hypothetical protein